MAAAVDTHGNERGGSGDPTWRRAPDESISVHPDKLHDVRARDLLIRFAFGAATSIVAGIVTLLFGPRAGGVLLAFPALLAASLTLIEEEESPEDAREDARGAVLGAVALTVFAVVVALTVTRVLPGLALLFASLAWLVVAVGAYLTVWGRRRGILSERSDG
jgi:phosphotransferase system  glucose/maltose/N-acetylglucosamine-specific IIC component